MSNITPKPDHRTLPRRKRPLSTRDQAILLASRTQGRTQAQLAADFRLSQSRISQILRRAEKLTRQSPPSPSDPNLAPAPALNPLPTPNPSLAPSPPPGSSPNPQSPNESALDPATLARARAQDIYTRAL